LLGSEKATVIGRPQIEGAQVKVTVEEKTLDKKVTILKFRRRKNSKSKNGFRRSLTILRVVDIIPPDNLKEHL
jgi:large subunit ribosomal protein L21